MMSPEFDEDTVLVPAVAGRREAPTDVDADTVLRARTLTGESRDRRADVDEETIIGATPSSGSRAANQTPPTDVAGPRPGYRWRINGSAPRSLDRPVIIGRAPRTPRIVDGVTPVLETVDSPSKLVSSTHVRLERQGVSVVVTDARSTNGTLVTSPGAARVALGPGDSVVAVPGTLIDIGDGNVIEILPMERARPTDLFPLERLSP